MTQKLLIQDFEVWIKLGCNIEEKKFTQPVHFNLEIIFENEVLGCQTDDLEDALDYVEITNILKMISTKKTFNLIEHLNYQVHSAVVEYLKSKKVKGEIKLSVKKIRVPVENLRNGVVFSCETKL